MALLKTEKIRELSPKERTDKLTELRNELLREKGISAMGGAPPSPGKIKALRTNIARIVTVQREEGER